MDDEQDIRTLLNIYLKRLGYDVVEAADGVEAVETVRADKDIDLIVMDIMMPKLSGTEGMPADQRVFIYPVLF
ncbi:MAG: response regulator [Coprococcus sp.]